MTYSVTVDGYSWEHGLSKFLADGAKELLRDLFPGANVVIIRER